MTPGPTVAVLDPSMPFSVAAVVACTDRDHAAAVALEMRAAWPNGVVSVLYPDGPARDAHPAGKGRP